VRRYAFGTACDGNLICLSPVQPPYQLDWAPPGIGNICSIPRRVIELARRAVPGKRGGHPSGQQAYNLVRSRVRVKHNHTEGMCYPFPIPWPPSMGRGNQIENWVCGARTRNPNFRSLSLPTWEPAAIADRFVVLAGRGWGRAQRSMHRPKLNWGVHGMSISVLIFGVSPEPMPAVAIFGVLQAVLDGRLGRAARRSPGLMNISCVNRRSGLLARSGASAFIGGVAGR